ncbi:hypothetical protein HPB51_004775 [Rhipicephalus microplus]|uniref:Uncharacterized protein n=1 Tax=Rhipicephalus microplus TaxID=6941 RepID=A0A9J6EQU1_RHIMP|nr:hypothetical protein HPB51_004775 [Rhipicephalus microplus]
MIASQLSDALFPFTGGTPDETGYHDHPATPPMWLLHYHYPAHHPDYWQPPPPPPPPPAGVSFIPFEEILLEARRSNKAEGRRALRLERTTEPEPQLNIGASPSVPELKLSPPYEQSSLPMVALSYDRRKDPHTQPPKWATAAHHRSFPEAIPGRSGERDEEKHGGRKDNRQLATGVRRKGAFLAAFQIHDS